MSVFYFLLFINETFTHERKILIFLTQLYSGLILLLILLLNALRCLVAIEEH